MKLYFILRKIIIMHQQKIFTKKNGLYDNNNENNYAYNSDKNNDESINMCGKNLTL